MSVTPVLPKHPGTLNDSLSSTEAADLASITDHGPTPPEKASHYHREGGTPPPHTHHYCVPSQEIELAYLSSVFSHRGVPGWDIKTSEMRFTKHPKSKEFILSRLEFQNNKLMKMYGIVYGTSLKPNYEKHILKMIRLRTVMWKLTTRDCNTVKPVYWQIANFGLKSLPVLLPGFYR
ncbi:hypothetical protein AVEN_176883-1 [Araneus ventricosus]|uniref:Uncharacterized protein n=1 Tax=Araneus ventricosus TaxID=182803 RepID=A0A4Y2KRF0_ARAVE|nr:hypothetical protein AVEN_176883-1 [Araneus ventricosus]